MVYRERGEWVRFSLFRMAGPSWAGHRSFFDQGCLSVMIFVAMSNALVIGGS